MAGLRPFTIGLALIILFAIMLFSFMTGMVITNNPNSTIGQNPLVNASQNSLNSAASSLSTLGTQSKTLLTSYQPSPVFVFLIVYSAFAIPLNFLNFLVFGTGSIITILFTLLFGNGNNAFSIVIGFINAILIITIVIVILRAIRSGETER